ncbi:acyl-CoA N-acyltransferase [Fadolivirus algeromassiliense]|jgi:hypothetical protein|uniref:Acyl-CoA N-acyltransferase n=1 Tax=Fadolivirus FV1/VV64 TaxID=3070911 RepID=A0A7D3QTS6_9VIRU|nr:acyl-CoA N-acyltransferase [Fadolivirus algeromassiliense]QKF93563.1 acyl-CoA N-acyltransferase [Fadolivirus FV1/VV64]
MENLYFSEQWGRIWEKIYGGQWEYYCNESPYILHVYIKKPIHYNNTIYYELISPYGVSGFYYDKNITAQDIELFLNQFKDHCIKNNYINEFVRFTPSIELNDYFYKFYDIKFVSNYYYVDLSKGYDHYLKTAASRHRCCVKNHMCDYKIIVNTSPTIDTFRTFMKIYNITMNDNNAKSFYFFPESLYSDLLNIKCFIIELYKDNELASSSIFIVDNNTLYYFLSGKNSNYKKTHNLTLDVAIKYGIEHNMTKLILGGGVQQNDSLERFKKSITPLYEKYYVGNMKYINVTE